MVADSSQNQNSVPLYEREVRDYLAENLYALGLPGLELVQVEYPVKFGSDDGRIDILAKEPDGTFVVIEIKRGIAGKAAVAQLQSYMGAILMEFPDASVVGYLVATGLDGATSAALLVSNIEFIRFETKFTFHQTRLSRPKSSKPGGAVVASGYRENYWESLGGTVTRNSFFCPNCNQSTRVVAIGSQRLCGQCGKSTH